MRINASQIKIQLSDWYRLFRLDVTWHLATSGNIWRHLATSGDRVLCWGQVFRSWMRGSEDLRRRHRAVTFAKSLTWCHLYSFIDLETSYNGSSLNLTLMILQPFTSVFWTSCHSCLVSSLMVVSSKFACSKTTSRYAILVQAVYQKQLGCACSGHVFALMIWT